MSSAMAPDHHGENLASIYHPPHDTSVKLEPPDAMKDLMTLRLGKSRDFIDDFNGQQSSLDDIKEECKDSKTGDLIVDCSWNERAPISTDEFCFNLNIDGVFLKRDERKTWECRRCLPHTLHSSCINLLCHRIQAHPDSFSVMCNQCGEEIKNVRLLDHFEIHSKTNGCGRNSAKIHRGDKSETREEKMYENNCDFQNDDDGFDSDEDCQPLAFLSSKMSRLVDTEKAKKAMALDSEIEGTTDLWLCDLCEEGFEDAEELKKHVRQHENRKGKIKNPRAAKKRKGLISRLKGISDRVERDVGGEKPKRKHLCSYCGKTFSLSYKLKKHYRVHTGEKPYHCTQCGKNFSSCSNLKRHVLIHSGEKPYLCTFCGKSFNHPTTFKTHSYMHAGLKNLKLKPTFKKYSCEYCNKAFAARSTLTIHIRVHTKERPFHCDTCEKSFPQKSALTQHLLNHTGVKPHTCTYCSKTFKTVVCLKTHVRTHTGEKPYKCGVCERAFSSQSNLYRHRATHTGVKRFSCDYCGKEFSQRSALGDHINIHTGARPYCCPYCTSSFANKSTLVKHVAIHAMKHVQNKS